MPCARRPTPMDNAYPGTISTVYRVHAAHAGTANATARAQPLDRLEETVRSHWGSNLYLIPDYSSRLAINRLISLMALAGLSSLGQVLVQFKIVWQR